jgi:hypothetical protein
MEAPFLISEGTSTLNFIVVRLIYYPSLIYIPSVDYKSFFSSSSPTFDNFCFVCVGHCDRYGMESQCSFDLNSLDGSR